jgi:predicted GIY-YIG superfamily endonuclease
MNKNINIYLQVYIFTFNMSYYVYLLLSSDNSTYVGATVDLNRRLRQHNKEISGGAFATGSKVEKGETWIRVAHVEGFPDWQSALQFEWRWKQLSRKQDKNIKPICRRLNALKELLALDRPTSKAILYSEWPNGKRPQVVLEDNEARMYYE